MKTIYLIEHAPPKSIERIFKFGLMFFILLCLTSLGYGQAEPELWECTNDDMNYKHIKRDLNVNNLLLGDNSHFTGGEGNWVLENGCISPAGSLWNPDGYVSLRGADVNETCPDLGRDRMKLVNLEINGGQTYTLSFQARTPEYPTNDCHVSPVLFIYIHGKNEDGEIIKSKGVDFGLSQSGEWEEIVYPFKMPDAVKKVDIQIIHSRDESFNDDALYAHIDNVYVFGDIGFEDAPSCKKTFDGGKVKVDPLGNVYVKNETGEWEWFFPFIIHGDSYRDVFNYEYVYGQGSNYTSQTFECRKGWKLYSNQGFNAIITGQGNPTIVKNAVEAGLKYLPHLGHFYKKPNIEVANAEVVLESNLNYMHDPTETVDVDGVTKYVEDHLLFYYIDNEIHPTWDVMTTITNQVIDYENNILGGRQAPIYMLNGYMTRSPMYLNGTCHIGDITGTYISSGAGDPINHRWISMDNQSNQIMPTVIAQMNHDRAFKGVLWGSIASGAKGMDYWRDVAPGNSWYIPPGVVPNIENNPRMFEHIFDVNDNDGDFIPNSVDATANCNSPSNDDANNNGVLDYCECSHPYNSNYDCLSGDDVNGNGIVDEFEWAPKGTSIEKDDITETVSVTGIPLRAIPQNTTEIDNLDILGINNPPGGPNGVKDECEVTPGAVGDLNGDGYLDICQWFDRDNDGVSYMDINNAVLNENGTFIESNDIVSKPWWNELPTMVQEIQNMEELIKQPHWAKDWKIESCVGRYQNLTDPAIQNIDGVNLGLAYGIREIVIDETTGESEKYIILGNYVDSGVVGAIEADLTFTGLPIGIESIRKMDYTNMLGGEITTEAAVMLGFNDFRFTIEPGDGVVYRIIENDCPETVVLPKEQDVFVNDGGFAGNSSHSLQDPGTADNFVLADASLELWVVMNGQSLEEDIEVQITDPAGNTFPLALPASTTWNNNQAVRYFNIDVPNGTATGTPANWLVEFNDSNGQNSNFEYKVGYVRLTYTPTLPANDPVACSRENNLSIVSDAYGNQRYLFNANNACPEAVVAQSNVILSDVSLELELLPFFDSCEEDIEVQVRTPNYTWTSPYTPLEDVTCESGTQGVHTVTISIPDVVVSTPVGTAGWIVRFRDTNLQNNGAWEYRVLRAELNYDVLDSSCTGSEGLISENNTSIIIDGMDTEAHLITEKTMTIYPIPAMDKLNIDYHSNSTSPLKIEVFSNDGKVLLSHDTTVKEGLNTVQLNIEQLTAGHYFIRVYNAEDTQTQSFVKMTP